jgi:hypothetical protein
LNKSLARIHLGMVVFYALLVALACAIHLQGGKASGTGVLILAVIFGIPLLLHYLAMRGVRAGKRWGRNLSRVLGVLMLFAVPIGTILGAFMLMRTGKVDWQQSASDRQANAVARGRSGS